MRGLLDMKLGDVLLAGIAKDPQGAGRSSPQAITEIEAAPGPTPPRPGWTEIPGPNRKRRRRKPSPRASAPADDSKAAE